MQRATLVVTGLAREASLASAPGLVAVIGGGDSRGLEAALDALDAAEIGAVISFGLAGALDPSLLPGDLVIARSIKTSSGDRPASVPLVAGWTAELDRIGLPFRHGGIAGVDAPVLTPAGKAELRRTTGADAVDMESHLAADYAARNGLPFGALRVISDGAERSLPPIAGSAMRPDGSIDAAGVVAGLLRDPGQVPTLIATARDAALAFRVLRRVRGLLSPHGGLLGLDLR